MSSIAPRPKRMPTMSDPTVPSAVREVEARIAHKHELREAGHTYECAVRIVYHDGVCECGVVKA